MNNGDLLLLCEARCVIMSIREGVPMKFQPLTDQTADAELLKSEYASAHVIGNLRIGSSILFVRLRMKTFYIPYGQITRCFRRVRLVPARMCCGRGDLAVESMVICDASGELADVQMPGEKAGKAALEELKEKIPGAEFTAPPKADAAKDETGEATV